MERLSPAREAPPRERIARCRRSGEKGMGMSHTILLVDDDECVLDVTSRLLSMIGCRVIPARDGVEALVKLRENLDQVSLVMLDVNMPRLDGEATAMEVRAAAPEMPLVLMSGYPESHWPGLSRQAGLSAYLQ